MLDRVFGMLDEECVVPQGSEASYVDKMHSVFDKNELYAKPRLGKKGTIICGQDPTKADPELVKAPQRAIAEMSGTSRQPVIDLLARWEAERVLVRSGRRYAWVDPPGAQLLDRWISGYLASVRAKVEVGRFRLPVRGPEEVEALLEEKVPSVRYGGTAGGYRLSGHYRGPTTMAHLGRASAALRRKLRAVPDPEGELIWMRHVGQASAQSPQADTVNPLLIYAELVDDPDPRAGELAAIVREEWLQWST